MSIRAIFFDLDDTLRDRAGVIQQVLGPVWARARECYPDFSSATLEEYFRKLEGKPLTPTGELYTLTDFFTDVLSHCGVLDRALAGELAGLYSQGIFSTLQAFPDVWPTLEKLRGRYLLGVITNGPDEAQREKLFRLGLEGFFDLVVTSQAVKCMKPAPGIFRVALEEAGCQPGEAIFVGDSLANDVTGAKGAGMVAVWLNRKGQERPWGMVSPDFEIRSLEELFAIL